MNTDSVLDAYHNHQRTILAALFTTLSLASLWLYTLTGDFISILGCIANASAAIYLAFENSDKNTGVYAVTADDLATND